MEVRNNQRHPVVLEDGTILAAAGSEGSRKQVELSDADRARLVDRNIVTVIEEPAGDRGSPTTREGSKKGAQPQEVSSELSR